VPEPSAFRRSRLARPTPAPAPLDPVADRPSSSWTLAWVPRHRQLVVGSDPQPLHQGQPMTTPHGHGRSRRRRQRAWRPPRGRGGSTATRHRAPSTTDCSQSTIGPVARLPIDVPDPVIGCARASPAHPTRPAQPKPPCATRCKWATHRRMLVEPSPTATSGVLHAQQRGGLAAQPVPHRPGRSRTRLPARRAAG
jgi:hypothetical protein